MFFRFRQLSGKSLCKGGKIPPSAQGFGEGMEEGTQPTEPLQLDAGTNWLQLPIL